VRHQRADFPDRRSIQQLQNAKQIYLPTTSSHPIPSHPSPSQALSILTEQKGKLLLGPNKITVSTVGLVPFIDRFVEESRCMLAVSLHATTDEVGREGGRETGRETGSEKTEYGDIVV